MARRPLSSTFITVAKPLPTPPSPPMTLAMGTRHSSKISSQVWVPRSPIFSSTWPTVRPGVLNSTTKAVMPPWARLSGSVKAMTVTMSATSPLVT